MPLQPGTALGPYRIDAPLSAGGMGEVYRATDTRLDRTVAIKVLPEHVAADPDLKQRFEHEARTVAALNHPHICTLYDIGDPIAERNPAHRVRLRHHLAALITLVLCAGALLSAQQPRRTEAVDVARVLVDARVLDPAGQPVLGLEPEDFEVKIGGQRVYVESVQRMGSGESGSGRVPSTVLAGVLEPEVRGRLIVVVVQKSLEPVRVIGLLRLLQESGRLLSHLTPDDRVAILSFDSHLKIWLDFTGDLNHARAVLAEDVMFRKPARIEPTPGLSLVAGLSQDLGHQTYTIEKALRLLGNALEPLPGSKSVVLVGYGFGRLTVALGTFGATLDPEYEEARDALHAARAAVFCLDVTDADYHTFEHGLQTVAADTGGFFARTHLFAQRTVDRVANALAGHYVLFTEKPDLDPGTHRIEVRLVREKGSVFARRTYVD